MVEGVTEITEAVEFAVVGDRLRFILHSGGFSQTFSISFHKARNAAHTAVALLDRHDTTGKVMPFRKESPPAHV